jgi:hypothetical protein
MADLYILQIDDWCEWYDLNVPDHAWITLAQNQDLETLIEIVDPLWKMAFEIATPSFVQKICID